MITTHLSRERQTIWIGKECRILQDQELINLIIENNFSKAIGVGSVDYFKDFIEFVQSGPVNFCIYIQTQEYNFWALAEHLNDIIANGLTSGALLYLSINKYQAVADCYDNLLAEDYDTAILQFVQKNINAKIENYYPCGNDGGVKFNWVHPLTRFYLRT